jgi:hypothetical protein
LTLLELNKELRFDLTPRHTATATRQSRLETTHKIILGRAREVPGLLVNFDNSGDSL